MKFQAVLLIVFVASAYQAIVLGGETPTAKDATTDNASIVVPTTTSAPVANTTRRSLLTRPPRSRLTPQQQKLRRPQQLMLLIPRHLPRTPRQSLQRRLQWHQPQIQLPLRQSRRLQKSQHQLHRADASMGPVSLGASFWLWVWSPSASSPTKFTNPSSSAIITRSKV